MTQKTERYLAMSELAGRLNLPESTMRYYCKRFGAYLPGEGEGRRRRYAPEAQAVLEFIISAMQRHKNAMTVELLLKDSGLAEPSSALAHGAGFLPDGARCHAPVSEVNFAPDANSARLMLFMERQCEAITQIASALEILAQSALSPRTRRGGKNGPETRAGLTGGGDEALLNEVQALRRQVQEAEKVHQEDLEQLRKWLSRLGEAVGNR